MKLLSLVFSGGNRFPWSKKKSVKQLETLREYVYQEFPVRFPLPAYLCALQQNLEVAMVLAVIAIIHHELATNSSCLRLSSCSCSVPWTQSYLLTLSSPSQQKKLKFPFSFTGCSVALPLLTCLSCLLLHSQLGLPC